MNRVVDVARLLPLLRENGVARLRLFGSMARGEAIASSDIDLLVDFAIPKSLLDLVTLERKLSEALGQRVDLLPEPALSPYVREQILHDAVTIYDAG